MNILLVHKSNALANGNYSISGKEFLHLKNVLKVSKGQKIFAGEVNGLMGYVPVLEIAENHIMIEGNFELQPPPALPITLILALPRPKMLKRILRDVSMLGVKNIYLINTSKVEKSFWYTDLLEEKLYERYLLEGLSQSKDTFMPTLIIKKLFKPFVQDELRTIIKNSTAFVAHPGDYPVFPQGITEPLTLAIGPEGGFSDYEIDQFEQIGFSTVQCGSRILRMETAVVSLLSQHGQFLANGI